MTQHVPLANSTVIASYPSHVPASPSSDLSRKAFDHFELTERLLEQEYFWMADWQEAEREADEDIKARRIRRFSNAQEAINYLRSSES